MSKIEPSTKLLPFDAARYLTDDAAVAEYMTAVLETDDPDLLLLALGDVARARGGAGGLGPGGIEEARQRRQLRAEGPELLRAIGLLPSLNPPPVDLVQRLLLASRPAAVDDGGVEGLHRFQGVGEVRRCLAQVLVEAAVAFLPGTEEMALELFREAGAHQGMGVEGIRLARISRRQQAVVP